MVENLNYIGFCKKVGIHDDDRLNNPIEFQKNELDFVMQMIARRYLTERPTQRNEYVQPVLDTMRKLIKNYNKLMGIQVETIPF